MTETRPTALQLAEFLENLIADPMWPDHFELSKRLSVNVVEELRRLYQENQSLRDRLAQPEHVHAIDISQERVDKTAKDRHEWGLVTDDALIGEVRRRGFTIRDAQISPKIKDEYELCCQKYDTCTEPCTPRGRHLAKREWVGLTTTEAEALIKSHWGEMKGGPLVMNRAYIRDIEAKLKEKNT